MPQVNISIESLVDDYKAGELKLPEIQRSLFGRLHESRPT